MATIRPFRALRPLPEKAKEVSCVPYDVVSTQEARLLAQGNPLSFLHVTRAEIDMPDETDPGGKSPYDESVYQRALQVFEAMRSEGVFTGESEPCFYAYRLAEGAYAQTGLACLCSVEEYDRNVIKKHEHTKKDKEDDRLRHMLALSTHAEPVLMAFRVTRKLSASLERACSGTPLYDFESEDGVRNSIWRVEDVKPFQKAFERIPALYIADGHHRAAAASRLHQHLESIHGPIKGEAEANYFPAVLFPSDELRILSYNRYVFDLNGMGPREFLEAVRRRFSVTGDGSPEPCRKGVFGMYLQGTWYELRPLETPSKRADPVAALDISVLHERLLRPLLGVLDQTKDNRIAFIGGSGSAQKLEKRVDSEGGVAFTLYPVDLEELLHVANAGMIMPPKSTWFWPKLRSGLLIHTF